MHAVIHYGEIALKGKNKPQFIQQLRQNVYHSCQQHNVTVEQLWQEQERLIGTFYGKEQHLITALHYVCGIENFAVVEIADRDKESIVAKAQQFLPQADTPVTMAARVSRGDKKLPFSSKEVEEAIGYSAISYGHAIDLEQPQHTIYVEITRHAAYIYTQKYSGPGGLPTGISGHVLCLLSGGIDSAVAAWLLMKRGCTVDFVHFHALRNNEQVLQSKICDMVKQLNAVQYTATLYTVPYHRYQLQSQGQFPEQYDLMLFRHVMLRFADKLRSKYGYDAIVTGDSLGQVASQTMANLITADDTVDGLFFRPLLGNNKQEIIGMGKSISLNTIAEQPYKDCCSIISKHPATNMSVETMERMERVVDISALLQHLWTDMEQYIIDTIAER